MKKATRRPSKEELQETWYLIDAKDKVLGRLASRIAKIMIGKDKANFDPAVMVPVKVVVVNANQIKVSGDKMNKKTYYRHSGYPGGLKTTLLSELMSKQPTEAIRRAVSGMLPKNKLRQGRLNNLKVYANDKHPHEAQQPVKLSL